jgi:Fe-S-cluster containining protein
MPAAESTRRDPSRLRSQLLEQDSGLVQIVDAALANAALRAGEHLVCRPGCTPCCHGAFAINPLDALRLRTAMTELNEVNPELAAAIAARADIYLQQHGPSFPGDQKTGVLGSSPEHQEAFEEFANEAACPALDPESGRCDLYAARPMTCRVFGPPIRSFSPDEAEEGLSICELCFTHSTSAEIAACEMVVPHEEEQRLVEEVERVNADSQPSPAGETIVAYCLVHLHSATAS